MAKFSITYEVVTPESAEMGDVESRGWEYESCDIHEVGLASAIRMTKNLGCCSPDTVPFTSNGRTSVSLYSVDPDIDYCSGEQTFYCAHFKDFTPSTIARIVRAVCN